MVEKKWQSTPRKVIALISEIFNLNLRQFSSNYACPISFRMQHFILTALPYLQLISGVARLNVKVTAATYLSKSNNYRLSTSGTRLPV